jgi:putative methionine-R-sulfoxide reductase with GAF domain
MISLPLRWGDRVVGVFNVVSSEPHAFDPAEETYIESLGGVIAVAVGVDLARATEDHASGSE